MLLKHTEILKKKVNTYYTGTTRMVCKFSISSRDKSACLPVTYVGKYKKDCFEFLYFKFKVVVADIFFQRWHNTVLRSDSFPPRWLRKCYQHHNS